MKHDDKITLAKKMRTRSEEARGTSIWSSAEWYKRKNARMKKQLTKRHAKPA